jgi:hypothetical protein
MFIFQKLYHFYNEIFLKARTSSTMFGVPVVVRVLQFHKPDSNGTVQCSILNEMTDAILAKKN